VTPSLITIVLPVHNQVDHVASVVQEYEAALTHLAVPYELILAVNGCTDGSLDVCRELERDRDTIRVIECVRGAWGLAVRAGLDAARGDLLCYTNLARTSPEDLTRVVQCAAANRGTVVKAMRKIRESVVRRFGSLLYNLECRALFDLPGWDINGTPKAFPRAFDRLLRLRRDDDLIDLEFNVVCRRAGYDMLEVPIHSYRRHGGRSTTGFRSAAKLYAGAVALWLDLRDHER